MHEGTRVSTIDADAETTSVVVVIISRRFNASLAKLGKLWKNIFQKNEPSFKKYFLIRQLILFWISMTNCS